MTKPKIALYTAELRLFKKIASNEKLNPTYCTEIHSIVPSPHLTKNEDFLTAVKNVFPDIKSFNCTFWETPKNTEKKDKEKLHIHQIIHYLTTYCIEEYFGTEPGEFAYIPKDKVKAEQDVSVRIIKTMTFKQEKKEIEKLIYSGRTLSQKDILDIATISENRDIEFDVDKIKNKEIRTILLEKIVENQTHQIWRKTPFFSNKDKNHKRSQIIVILAALGIIACLLLLISCGKSAKNEKFGNFKDKPTVDIKNVLYKEFNYNKEDFYVLSEEQDGNIYTLLLSYKTLPDDKIISRETDMPAGELFYLSMKKKRLR